MMPRSGMIVSLVCVLAAGVSAAEAEEEPLRSIAAIQALAPAELDRGRQVRFEGVVTLSPGGLVVQQEDHGIYLAAGARRTEVEDARPGATGPGRLTVGMLVEIEGRATRGGWTPIVIPARIRIMGEAPLPEPAALDLARRYSGADSGRRVAATGIVQSPTGTPGRLTRSYPSRNKNMEPEVAFTDLSCCVVLRVWSSTTGLAASARHMPSRDKWQGADRWRPSAAVSGTGWHRRPDTCPAVARGRVSAQPPTPS